MEKLTDILSEVLNLLQDGVEFAKGEIPLLIQDFLNWGIIRESRDVFIALFLLVIFIIFLFRFKEKADKSKKLEKRFEGNRNILLEGKLISDVEDDAIAYNIIYYFFLTAAICASIAFVVQVLDIFKVIFAPRVYLIEEVSKLLSNNV
jgi:flagellar biosynthesis protein FlhB